MSEDFQKKVAIKVIRKGMDSTQVLVIRTFQRSAPFQR